MNRLKSLLKGARKEILNAEEHLVAVKNVASVIRERTVTKGLKKLYKQLNEDTKEVCEVNIDALGIGRDLDGKSIYIELLLPEEHSDYWGKYKKYEDIADGITSLGSGTTVYKDFIYRKSYLRNGITYKFSLNLQWQAEIPEEEINLLKRLGKIQTSYHEASISEGIVCTK